MCFKISNTYTCAHPMTESSWIPADVLECPAAVRRRNGTVERCGDGAGIFVNVFIYRGLCDACWSVDWLVYNGWGCCRCSEEMEDGAERCADRDCGHEVCGECHARYDCDCPNCGTEIRQDENWCPTCSTLVVPAQPSIYSHHSAVNPQPRLQYM
ncbi:hypothetical protein PspLS_06864 [Pyricularia sp. CBS 133598]|nr:hypothetical protein PspLS_06864 [Pyricularia sp. CBS 133598]